MKGRKYTNDVIVFHESWFVPGKQQSIESTNATMADYQWEEDLVSSFCILLTPSTVSVATKRSNSTGSLKPVSRDFTHHPDLEAIKHGGS